MNASIKHVASHLLVPGYRGEAVKTLLVCGLNALTGNKFMRVLIWLGLGSLIVCRLPLTPEQIKLGQEIARRHDE
jgi:hypothetical protein